MRKIAILSLLLGLFSLSLPLEAYANHHIKNNTKVVKKKTNKNVKTKQTKSLKPRYAKNINNPEEGELLKLEGMIKDVE